MNFKRIAMDVDTKPMLEKLAKVPELWTEATWRQTYPGSAHAMADSIILRWPSELTMEAAFQSLEAVDYPPAAVLMPEVGHLFAELRDRLGVINDFGRVMITRLGAGAVITPHVDEGRYAEEFDRFHICLAGGRGNSFRCGGEIYHPEPGDIFWFNHKLEHSVQNFAEEGYRADRLHLIIDMDVPSYKRLRGRYYQAERLSDLWEEVYPLLDAHWREVAHYEDIPLEPDEEAYAALEDAGCLRVFTARDCGRLIGYACFMVRPNLHYRSSLTAIQDVLFVHPAYRRGMTGSTLIRVAETRLRAEGVQLVYHHAKRTNRLGELLERLGYELVDGFYAKRLDKKKE